eukprot:jgi/Tetstr1/460081/TSEL_005401.t1
MASTSCWSQPLPCGAARLSAGSAARCPPSIIDIRSRPLGSPSRIVRQQRPGRSLGLLARGAAQGDQGGSDPTPWSAPGYKGAAVSSMPDTSQAAIVAGVFAGLGVGTAASCSLVGPAIARSLPGFFAFSESTWPLLGVTFLAAGVAHFTVEQGFLDMYPHRGAWGIYYLPGSPSFHVRWTGVAEVLGGAGLLLGALPLDAVPGWLEGASAAGLFALTWAVTPANIYMFTHNAPGPVPEDQELPVIPPAGHFARGVLQIFLLSVLWGIATGPHS